MNVNSLSYFYFPPSFPFFHPWISTTLLDCTFCHCMCTISIFFNTTSFCVTKGLFKIRLLHLFSSLLLEFLFPSDNEIKQIWIEGHFSNTQQKNGFNLEKRNFRYNFLFCPFLVLATKAWQQFSCQLDEHSSKSLWTTHMPSFVSESFAKAAKKTFAHVERAEMCLRGCLWRWTHGWSTWHRCTKKSDDLLCFSRTLF